jgi:hypothetical protein
MAKTIKNQFSNVYGEGKNLNIGKNKSVKELLNNIPNVELSPNEINNELSNSITNKLNNKLSNKLNNKLNKSNGPLNPVNVEKSIGFNTVNKSYSPFKIIYLLIIIIIFSIIGVIYYYRDIIMQYLDSITNKKDITSDKIDSTNEKVDHTSAKIDSTNAKVDDTSSKIDSTNAKVDSTSAKIDGLEDKINKLSEKKDCPAIDTLNTKIDKVSSYSNEQNVTDNGFCYIGYDNGQRDCIDVYAGDICMSGEIFPTLDICINPKLRV